MGRCTECHGKGEITLNALIEKDPQQEYTVECPICYGLYECDACGQESAVLWSKRHKQAPLARRFNHDLAG